MKELDFSLLLMKKFCYDSFSWMNLHCKLLQLGEMDRASIVFIFKIIHSRGIKE